jgi:hypothetical protein
MTSPHIYLYLANTNLNKPTTTMSSTTTTTSASQATYTAPPPYTPTSDAQSVRSSMSSKSMFKNVFRSKCKYYSYTLQSSGNRTLTICAATEIVKTKSQMDKAAAEKEAKQAARAFYFSTHA